MKRSVFPLIVAASTLAALASAQTPPEGVSLMPGDAAPALKVSKFVKGAPVKAFKNNKLYVVEFWATWCGPCRMSIPHLTEMQKKYGSKVTFIGTSVYETDQALVEPFVKEMGSKMGYTVAMDLQDSPTARRGFMAKSWMEAAGQNGIPTAFVVDKGKIAWIGHPMALADPLAQIVKGSWDTNAFRKTFAVDMEKQAAEMAQMRQVQTLNRDFAKAIKEKNWDAASAACDNLAKLDGQETSANVLRYKLAVRRDGLQAASAQGQDLIKGITDPMVLNGFAWEIVDPASKVPAEYRDNDLAVMAGEKAVELTQSKVPAILDTLAWSYFAKGDTAHAITTEKQALALVGKGEAGDYEKALKVFEGK